MHKLLVFSFILITSLSAQETSSFPIGKPFDVLKELTQEEAKALKAKSIKSDVVHTSVYKPNK